MTNICYLCWDIWIRNVYDGWSDLHRYFSASDSFNSRFWRYINLHVYVYVYVYVYVDNSAHFTHDVYLIILKLEIVSQCRILSILW